MATQPQFASTIRVERGTVNTANSARDGSGTIVGIFAANTSLGSYVRNIRIQCEETTAAGLIRIFTNQSGTYKIYDEVTVTAITPSDTVKAFSSTLNLNLSIPNGTSIGVSTTQAKAFSVTIDGANY